MYFQILGLFLAIRLLSPDRIVAADTTNYTLQLTPEQETVLLYVVENNRTLVTINDALLLTLTTCLAAEQRTMDSTIEAALPPLVKALDKAVILKSMQDSFTSPAIQKRLQEWYNK